MHQIWNNITIPRPCFNERWMCCNHRCYQCSQHYYYIDSHHPCLFLLWLCLGWKSDFKESHGWGHIVLGGNVWVNQTGAPTCQLNLYSYFGHWQYLWPLWYMESWNHIALDLVFMSTFYNQSMSIGCIGKLGHPFGLLRHYLLKRIMK